MLETYTARLAAPYAVLGVRTEGECLTGIEYLPLGAATLASTGGLSVPVGVIDFDLPVMTAVAMACLPIFFTGHLIARWEGFVFLGYYAAYTAYLIMASAQHDALPAFSAVMLWFVVPLTLLTLGIAVVRVLGRASR